jgi:hypothetical protein
MRYYEAVAGTRLADEFYAEFRFFVELAAKNPQAFNPRKNGLRRVNLERFPHHFWFLLKMTCCGFWLCDITPGAPVWAWDANDPAPAKNNLGLIASICG